MGLPASTFTLLWAATHPERPGHKAANQELSQFRLFVLVILDLHRDARLAEEISERWARLDKETGEHLLFFAPTDPPETWRSSREVLQRAPLRVLRKRVGAREIEFPVTGDPTRAMQETAQLLHLPAWDRPCLLVFRGLHEREGWVLETSAADVGTDLRELGAIASDVFDERPVELEAKLIELAQKRILQRFDVTGEPIGDALALVPASALAAGESDVGRQYALADLEVRLEQLRRQVRANFIDTSSDDHRSDLLLVLSVVEDQLARALAVDREAHRLEPVPALRAWEPYSRVLMERGDRLWLLVQSELGRDPAPAMICWAKALEYELSSSLGHELRRLAGVALPSHWWIHQEGFDAKVGFCGGTRTIDLNRRHRDAVGIGTSALWLPPALGELRLAAEVMAARVGQVSFLV